MSTNTPATTTVRGSVEKAGTADPKRALVALVDEFRPTISALLTGTGQSLEAFGAGLINSYRAVPELWACSPVTVLGASLKCAQLGLVPNDGRSLAWILPYAGKASFQMGYRGYMELTRRAVPGSRFDGRPVYPNDEIDVQFGRPEPLIHRPAVLLGKPRGGEATAWYVRVMYPDGTENISLLDREEVERHRSFSKQPNGQMWTKSYDQAALKSCTIDLKRFLPESTQMAVALDGDDNVHDVREMEPIDVIDHPSGELGTGE